MPKMMQRDQQPYKCLQVLGDGANGTTYLAVDLLRKRQVAIKSIRQSSCTSHLLSALLNHRQLQHPHIIQLERVFVSRNSVSIVTDWANGGSLLQYALDQGGRLPEPTARWMLQQLVLAVDFCHRMGMSNRDIRLETILLQVVEGLPRPLLKLAGVNYSRSLRGATQSTGQGTLCYYTAPEVLEGRVQPHNDTAADVWSCGVVLYALLVGHYPFDLGASVADDVSCLRTALQQMQSQHYFLPPELSAGAAALLHGMLHPDSQQRFSLARIVADPWFMTGLPPAALSMNTQLVRAALDAPRELQQQHYQQQPAQSAEEIQALLAAVLAVNG